MLMHDAAFLARLKLDGLPEQCACQLGIATLLGRPLGPHRYSHQSIQNRTSATPFASVTTAETGRR